MRLELHSIKIRDARFGEKTAMSDRVLYIQSEDLKHLLLQDKRIGRVEVELAHPGEKCRILQVSDVIEPRVKLDGDGYFSGVLSRCPSGEGRTLALRGAAVAMNDYSEGKGLMRDPNGEIIDMSGPASEFSPYSQIHHVVILPHPADGVSLDDYRAALKLAGLKTAVYLARAGKDAVPDDMEVYDLPAIPERPDTEKDLPRVGYIFQVFSSQFGMVPGEPVLYGGHVSGNTPTILHPNEILDGALLCPYRMTGIETYMIQNHPVIKELYRRHGKELYFAGVVLTIAFTNENESQRSANMAANLCKWVLGTDGVVLTKSWGGAPEVDLARTAQRCEELGIRTAVAMTEMAVDATGESGTIVSLPQLDAIVNMGTPFVQLTLPAVDRIIGRPVNLPDGRPVSGGIERQLRWIRRGACQLGDSNMIVVRY